MRYTRFNDENIKELFPDLHTVGSITGDIVGNHPRNELMSHETILQGRLTVQMNVLHQRIVTVS